MVEKGVGQPPQAPTCLVVVDADRLVGEVSARHHEWPPRIGHQQVMERRVGRHHADPAAVRGDGRCERRACAPARDDDRARRRLEQGALGGGQSDELCGRGGHDRERLRLTLLALAQPRHGRLVGRIAREVVAAEALYGEDAAVAQDRQRRVEPQA